MLRPGGGLALVWNAARRVGAVGGRAVDGDAIDWHAVPAGALRLGQAWSPAPATGSRPLSPGQLPLRAAARPRPLRRPHRVDQLHRRRAARAGRRRDGRRLVAVVAGFPERFVLPVHDRRVDLPPAPARAASCAWGAAQPPRPALAAHPRPVGGARLGADAAADPGAARRAQVLGFLARFPTAAACAAAPRADVVRAWDGLGYNRRAVNLHAAPPPVIAERRLPRHARRAPARCQASGRTRPGRCSPSPSRPTPPWSTPMSPASSPGSAAGGSAGGGPGRRPTPLAAAGPGLGVEPGDDGRRRAGSAGPGSPAATRARWRVVPRGASAAARRPTRPSARPTSAAGSAGSRAPTARAAVAWWPRSGAARCRRGVAAVMGWPDDPRGPSGWRPRWSPTGSPSCRRAVRLV